MVHAYDRVTVSKSASAVSEFAIYMNMRLNHSSFDTVLRGQPATLDVMDEVKSVSIRGPVAYMVGANQGLHIVDISDPDDPMLLPLNTDPSAPKRPRSYSGQANGLHLCARVQTTQR